MGHDTSSDTNSAYSETNSLHLADKFGGDDETRTRDLCREPVAVGGGRLQVIRFVLKSSERSTGDSIIKADGTTGRSIQYLLIEETDRFYVVKPLAEKDDQGSSSNFTLEVSRDVVQGYIEGTK